MTHSLSYIDPSAKIDKNVIIEPFTTIQEGVTIGEGTWIGPNVSIMKGAQIGKNCKIFPGSVISAEPQDLKYNGEKTITVIGDNTIIRECVTINRGTSALGKTQIGSNCLVMATVHVAHDCLVGNNVIVVNGVALAGHVEIQDWVIIGGLAAVHQFTRVGKHSLVAGASLVRKDVPPFVKAARNPISYMGINSIGLRRRGFQSKKIKEIQNIYRIIYQKKYNTAQSLRVIEGELEATPEREDIMQFIQTSQRGIMKGYNQSNGF